MRAYIAERPLHAVNHDGSTAELWCDDALSLLSRLPDGSVDLVVTSPPYCIGKEYDRSKSIDDFIVEQDRIFPRVFDVLKPGGSFCWQVGNHVRAGQTIPLDALAYVASTRIPGAILRNRIVWAFGHGVHCSNRFSGRHETILWFTKGDRYSFDLDAVRVPQKYPGKRHYKGPHRGEWSGNPNGKNPGDVWDIPNVKAKHSEKTGHPCQFPIALVRRLIRALTRPGGMVVDPYLGSGTTAVTALMDGRNFVGGDIERKYLAIAKKRLDELKAGTLTMRRDVPVRVPDPREAVAIMPAHFSLSLEDVDD